MDEDKVKGTVFKTIGVESDVRLKYLDVPKVIDMNAPIHNLFFSQLSDSSNYDLFSNNAIRKIIDFLHPIVIKYTILVLFLPFLFYIILYLLYTDLIYSAVRPKGQAQLEKDSDGNLVKEDFQLTIHYSRAHWAFIALLFVFSAYFLIFEIVQFKKHGLKYLSSIWNYIDLIPPIFVCVGLSLDIMDRQDPEYEDVE